MLLVFVGPQGSGKGTQAELLEKHGFEHLAMGDILKERMRGDGENADLIREYIERGDLIPDELNAAILDEALEKTGDNVVLDGYPRSESQAKHLLKSHPVELVVDIHISDEEAIRRLSKRRVCTATHHSYIADEITDEDRQKCREAGGEIIQREDDKPKAIQHRLEIYHEETYPLLDYFEEHDVPVERVDGEQSIGNVHADIVDLIT